MAEAFWREVQWGCVYAMALLVIGFALVAALLSPWFLLPVPVGTFLLAWMAYMAGREDEQDLELRRRAQRLREHPEWPVCEMHRRA